MYISLQPRGCRKSDNKLHHLFICLYMRDKDKTYINKHFK